MPLFKKTLWFYQFLPQAVFTSSPRSGEMSPIFHCYKQQSSQKGVAGSTRIEDSDGKTWDHPIITETTGKLQPAAS